MHAKRYFAVLFAILTVGAVFVPGLAVADVSGEPSLTAYAPNNRIAPGESTTLSVTLLNEGNVFRNSLNDPQLTEQVTTARGVQVRIDEGSAPITVKTGWQAIGNLPEGVSPAIPFEIVVDEDAAPGRYEIPVEARYTYTRFIGTEDEGAGSLGQRYEDGRWVRLSIQVVVEPRATFRVVGVESAVQVGESGYLDLSVENVGGGVARNARVTVESTNSDVTFAAGTESAAAFASNWEPGEVRTFRYRANVAADSVVRDYATVARITFEDEDGLYREPEPMIFGFVPGGEQTFEIDEVRSSLRVGEEGTISGEIVNTGDSTARNAVVRLTSESQTVTPKETEFPVGDLGPGERATFSFDVELSDSAESGPRQFSYVVQYRDADGDSLSGDPIDVRVEVGAKKPTFAVQPVNATFEAGSQSKLTFEVTNDGEDTLTDVSAKLFADDPLSSSDDEAFVDALEPGESTRITFVVAVDASAVEKTYPASIDFQYDDPEGDTLVSDTYRLPIQVVEPAEGDGSILVWLVGAGGLLTMAVVAVVVLRRRD